MTGISSAVRMAKFRPFSFRDSEMEATLAYSTIRCHHRHRSLVRQCKTRGLMNGLPDHSAGRPRSNGHGGGTPKASPPKSAGSPRSSTKPRPRNAKRRLEHGDDTSTSDSEPDGDGTGGRRRQPGVKRACNECRQQKVSHAAAIKQRSRFADASS